MQETLQRVRTSLKLVLYLCMAFCASLVFFLISPFLFHAAPKGTSTALKIGKGWGSPDTSTLGRSEADELIRYGRALIMHTALYLGPRGKVAQISNGMNCQNCHLDAGTRPFGNNYLAVAATYPKFRERSGTVETVFKRINDCIERSLNGTALDSASPEILAITAYIEWVGGNVPKGEKPESAGISNLVYPTRAADPVAGKAVFMATCSRCHGIHGEGQKAVNASGYLYPPVWGPHSYTTAAGLFRISRFAGYVKYNMPWMATPQSPQISDEQAWDVAAYVNSQPRPHKNQDHDWPDITAKPVDHPFGPFADPFSEKQHKFGPFEPIAAFKKSQKKMAMSH